VERQALFDLGFHAVEFCERFFITFAFLETVIFDLGLNRRRSGQLFELFIQRGRPGFKIKETYAE
jgi:hypothetical protein